MGEHTILGSSEQEISFTYLRNFSRPWWDRSLDTYALELFVVFWVGLWWFTNIYTVITSIFLTFVVTIAGNIRETVTFVRDRDRRVHDLRSARPVLSALKRDSSLPGSEERVIWTVPYIGFQTVRGIPSKLDAGNHLDYLGAWLPEAWLRLAARNPAGGWLRFTLRRTDLFDDPMTVWLMNTALVSVRGRTDKHLHAGSEDYRHPKVRFGVRRHFTGSAEQVPVPLRKAGWVYGFSVPEQRTDVYVNPVSGEVRGITFPVLKEWSDDMFGQPQHEKPSFTMFGLDGVIERLHQVTKAGDPETAARLFGNVEDVVGQAASDRWFEIKMSD